MPVPAGCRGGPACFRRGPESHLGAGQPSQVAAFTAEAFACVLGCREPGPKIAHSPLGLAFRVERIMLVGAAPAEGSQVLAER